jgi:CRISPR/Cas system-associated exonuclease Cas4 (RecB family)
MNACPRSGYLYALHKGEAQTADMIRGSAIHEILARATQLAVDEGEPMIPGELVKVEVDKVFAEMPVPVEQHDYVRECVWRWASETAFDPPAVIAVERLIVMQLEGFEVRMKVDYAALLEDGAAVHVVDYKSSRSMPQQEEVARRRPADGSLMARNFQLVLYALGLAYGVPVRVEPCGPCHGTGYLREIDLRGLSQAQTEAAIWDGTENPPCRYCDGRGSVEVHEPFPLAGRAQRFDLEFVYPGIEDKSTGLMQRRPMSLTRLELEEYLLSLTALLKRVRAAEESGDWPAVVSDAACSECPAPSMCPIPSELRDHRGTINSHEQAAEALEVLDRRKAVDAAIRREVKAFAKHNGPVRWGADRVSEFVSTFAEEIKDREGMFGALQRAVDFGEPFDRSVWVREKHGTSFRDRTLSADELAEEAIEEGDRA